MKETYKKYVNSCKSTKSGNKHAGCGNDEEKCKACYEDYLNFPYIEVDQKTYNRVVKGLRKQFKIKEGHNE